MRPSTLGPVIFVVKGSAYKIEQNYLGRYIRSLDKGPQQKEKRLLIEKELKMINESTSSSKKPTLP